MYDRIKKSITLKKQVKTFYINIEKLIWNYYQREYYFRRKNKNEMDEKIFKNHHLKWYYHENYVKSKFEKYGEYLGLILLMESSYIDKQAINLTQTGAIKAGMTHYKDGNHIEKELLDYIDNFLNNCVKYWNKHHKKWFTKKINRKINFSELSGVKSPYTREKPRVII